VADDTVYLLSRRIKWFKRESSCEKFRSSSIYIRISLIFNVEFSFPVFYLHGHQARVECGLWRQKRRNSHRRSSRTWRVFQCRVVFLSSTKPLSKLYKANILRNTVLLVKLWIMTVALEKSPRDSQLLNHQSLTSQWELTKQL